MGALRRRTIPVFAILLPIVIIGAVLLALVQTGAGHGDYLPIAIAAFPWWIPAAAIAANSGPNAPTRLLLGLLIGGPALQWALFGWLLDRRLQRLRRADPDRCARCHYDLRGSPGPRCPECGARIGKRDP